MSDENSTITGNDPVLPNDSVPHDLPGTEGGVVAEMDGTASHRSYYLDFDDIKKANKIKNQGILVDLPAWTLQGVRFRMLHFQVGRIRALSGRAHEEVRRSLSWPKNQDLPQWGKMEVNARTIVNCINECVQGSSVDIDGAVLANRMRNNGLKYGFAEGSLLPGVILRLRPLFHPWMTILREDIEEELRQKFNVANGKDLPPELDPEIDRILIVNAILDCPKGVVPIGGKQVDLSALNTSDLRSLFESHLLPPADFRGKIPSDPDAREKYFDIAYADHNPDLLTLMTRAHHALREAPNDEILARGDDFCAGYDPSYTHGTASYSPRNTVDLTALSLKDLRDLLRENFFPKIDLKQRPPHPKDRLARESFFCEVYPSFNNQFLNELLEREDQVREAPADEVLGKGKDYIVGHVSDSVSND